MTKPYTKESRKKFRLRQKLNQWKFLCKSEKDVCELIESYDTELNLVLNEILECTNETSTKEKEESNIIKINLEEEDSKIEEEFEDEKILNQSPDWAKKLYKKIALQTHPDKLDKMNIASEEKLKREEIFKEAAQSLKSGDYDLLLRLAGDLDLEFDIDDEILLDLVEESTKKMTKNIQKLQGSAPWAWGELEGNIGHRVSLIVNVWNQLQFPNVSRQAVEDYITCYEKYGNSKSWRKKYLNIKSAKQPRPTQTIRKKGEKPGPSISQSRKRVYKDKKV